jgi:hypothetical protein
MKTRASMFAGTAVISALLLGSSAIAFAQTTVPPGSNVTDPPAVYTGVPPVVYDPGTTPTNTSGNATATGSTGSTNSAAVSNTTGTTGTATTPGIPNTGAGGDVATNLVLLALAALAVAGGAAYAIRGRFA